MRYLFLVLFLLFVGGLVGVGMYTPFGQGVVDRFFPLNDYGILDDGFAIPDNEELPAEVEDVVFVPDVYVLHVDFVEETEDGYIAFVTLLETGEQFEMPVRPAYLGDAYTLVEVGDIVSVEVDSILEGEFEGDPLEFSRLYPITITIEEITEE